MNSTAMSYGAGELKQTAHRYWMYGFLISAAVHISLVGVLHLRHGADGITLPYDIPHHQITFGGGHPLEHINVETGGFRGGPARVSFTGTMPIPVPDANGKPEHTILSQGELSKGLVPAGEGGTSNPGVGAGSGVGEGIGFESVPPDTFRPCDRYPEVIKRVAPEYPRMAMMMGLEGRVVVKMCVNEEGRVSRAEIERTTDEMFDGSAAAAAKQFLFTPAIANGMPVKVWVRVPVIYKLQH